MGTEKKLTFLLLFLFGHASVYGQSHFFFLDSDDPGYYDSGFAFPTAPSIIEQKGPSGDKIPVNTTIKHQGENSLRLSWTSNSGGNWSALVIAPGFPFQDISNDDTLALWAYSPEALSASDLPVVFMEGDPNNIKTNKYPLSDYVDDIPTAEWVEIKVPLSIFFEDPQQVDINFAKVKAIIFGQGNADGIEHTLYIDEVRTYRGTGEIEVPFTPEGLTAAGYDSHVELKWEPVAEADEYQVFQSSDGGANFTLRNKTSDTIFIDFVAAQGANLDLQYRITALNQGHASDPSETVSVSTAEFTDEELLNMVQQYTFRYFWDFAHPMSGMARERNTSGDVVTVGGSGFGVMAILAGIERGFITREQGRDRILKIVNFLSEADRFHGAWPHWMNGITGEVIPFSELDDGADLVETAFIMQGLLTARQYFDQENTIDQEIAYKITTLWEAVEWDWFLKPPGNVMLWHWSPENGFAINLEVRGFNETMIVYLLAIASPTHAIPANIYRTGWAGGNYSNGGEFYNIPLAVGPDYGGPLFFAHYSYLGFDPRNKKDAYANYFERNKNHTLIHQQYSIDNPKNHEGYDANTWGLTASDDPLVGYKAHEPTNTGDNGTISPTAALSSMPYTPEESMEALKGFYRDYGNRLWGPMGFYDAFNPEENWFADSYLAIDQGPIIGMIENYRSQLLWDNFMKNPEIQPMLETIGFESTVTGLQDDIQENKTKLQNFPNPFTSSTRISFSLEKGMMVELDIFNLLGENVTGLILSKYYTGGDHEITFDREQLSEGIYILILKAGNLVNTNRLIIH